MAEKYMPQPAAACHSLPQVSAVHHALLSKHMLIQIYKPQILAWLLFNVSMPAFAGQWSIRYSKEAEQAAPTIQWHIQQWSLLRGRGSGISVGSNTKVAVCED